MGEIAIEQAFVRKLSRELGLRSAKLKALANAGWMDRLVPLPGGVSVYIEFKAVGKEHNLSEHQKNVIAYLTSLNVPVLVTSSVTDAIEFCKKHGKYT